MGKHRIVSVDRLAGEHRAVGGDGPRAPDKHIADVMDAIAEATAGGALSLADAVNWANALGALVGSGGALDMTALGQLFGSSDDGRFIVGGAGGGGGGDGLGVDRRSFVANDGSFIPTPDPRNDNALHGSDPTQWAWDVMIWDLLRGGPDRASPPGPTNNPAPPDHVLDGKGSGKPDASVKVEKPDKPVVDKEKPGKPGKDTAWDPDGGPNDAMTRAIIAGLPGYLQAQERQRHKLRTSSGQGPNYGPEGSSSRSGSGSVVPVVPTNDAPARAVAARSLAAVHEAVRRIRAGVGPGRDPVRGALLHALANAISISGGTSSGRF